MSTDVTVTNDEAWINLFILELRVRDVSGVAIGDAVASVRELLSDSGQSAHEAFGPAREYAASLDLPALDSRLRALQIVFLPVLGLFTFLVFALASSAWFAGDLLLLSMPQTVLLAVPVLLIVLFSFPFYPRAALTRRWLPVVLIVIAGILSAVAVLLAPSSADDAWLVFSAPPVLIGTMTVLVVLSVIGTIATIHGGGGDVIIDPSRLQGENKPRQPSRAFVVWVNWLFPILGVVIFLMTWGFALLRT